MVLIMRRATAAAVMLAALICGACTSGDDGNDDGGPPRVVVGAYPLRFLAEEIGGDDVRVTNITPAGTEPHDVELTSDDLDRIEDADLVLYIGDDFQPAVERAAKQRTE